MGWLKISKKNGIDPRLQQFAEEARKVIHGKDHELRLALTTLLANGHLLIEDMPGMGKTTFVMCLARLLGLRSSRIQFTNDLLPSDVLGGNIFDPKNATFIFHKGPIFADIVLGDELNRASPKSQSAFLQAMEERAVSMDGQTYPLPTPFFIIATQNPQTQAGTYPLPESQLDRFLMKLSLGYPDRKAEAEILSGGDPREHIGELRPLFNSHEIVEIQERVKRVVTAKPLIDYVQDLLVASRQRGRGLSPRAGLMLLQAARAWAYLQGRDLVLPEDIQDVAIPTLAHRLSSQDHAEIKNLIAQVKIP